MLPQSEIKAATSPPGITQLLHPAPFHPTFPPTVVFNCSSTRNLGKLNTWGGGVFSPETWDFPLANATNQEVCNQPLHVTPHRGSLPPPVISLLPGAHVLHRSRRSRHAARVIGKPTFWNIPSIVDAQVRQLPVRLHVRSKARATFLCHFAE